RSAPGGWGRSREAGQRFRPPPPPQGAEEVPAELRRVRRGGELTTELRPPEEVLQRRLQRPQVGLRDRCRRRPPLGELLQCLSEGEPLAPEWLEHPAAGAPSTSTPTPRGLPVRSPPRPTPGPARLLANA